MNVSETISLIEALYATGATHFKSHDFEVSFVPESKPDSGVKTPIEAKAQPPPPAPIDVAPEGEAFNPEATKRAQDLINMLKMKDENLVDQIFPDGAI